jgi:hypothetical protein
MYPTPSSPFALGSYLLPNHNIDFTGTVTLGIDPTAERIHAKIIQVL